MGKLNDANNVIGRVRNDFDKFRDFCDSQLQSSDKNIDEISIKLKEFITIKNLIDIQNLTMATKDELSEQLKVSYNNFITQKDFKDFSQNMNKHEIAQ